MPILTVLAALSLQQQPPAPPTPPPGGPAVIHTERLVIGGPEGRDVDADGDGVVTREEFGAPLARAFDRLDADHDGRLSRTEMQARREGPEGANRVVIHGPGGPEGHGPSPQTIIVGPDAANGLADMDKDGDGRISEAEFTAPLREAFARMDADRSGFVEAGEREGRDVRIVTRRLDAPPAR